MTNEARRIACGFVIVLLAAGGASAQVRSELYVSGLNLPVGFVQDPSDPTVQYVVQQGGVIRVIKDGALRPAPFLNLAPDVSAGGERGLLGLAFPPDYGTSGRFYVNFTNPDGDTVVARFRRSAGDPLAADKSTRFDLEWPGGLRYIDQPYSNHNGGHLAFGADGYLYVGMGDGGAGNDPQHFSQNPNSLLGKMLRIDVSVGDDDPKGYAVPPDNPFVDGTPIAALQEIWAFGLRNPWQFSFDDPGLGGTGALVMGDVGQDRWEEVNYEPAGSGGRNYGWRNREGAHPNVTTVPPAYQPLRDPIYEVPHPEFRSITGGIVYRGLSLGPAMVGRYFFADFSSGKVYSIGLTLDGNGDATASGRLDHTAQLQADNDLGMVSAIGTNAAGEIFLVNYTAGTILRVQGDCTVSVRPRGPLPYTADGGAGSLTVFTGDGCAWSASTPSAWITITSATAGTGAGSVEFEVTQQTAPTGRRGPIVVAGRRTTVVQAGCQIVLAPAPATIGAAGGDLVITVDASGGACPWTAVSRPPWITIAGSASGAGDGTVTLTVAPKTTPRQRAGIVVIGGRALRVIQAGI
jgi:glucose/arabinose dehydrogenase